MKFDWRYFTKEDYENIVKTTDFLNGVCVASVWIGDIAIDLVCYSWENDTPYIDYDFYIGHEDTGYGYKSVPYDQYDGGTLYMRTEESYEQFKELAEKDFEEFIRNSKYVWKSGLTLLDHANKPLEIWD